MAKLCFPRVWTLAMALPLAIALLMSPEHLLSQEPNPPDTPAAKSRVVSKPRGRLPVYYSRVVTVAQREQIYDIQAQYAEQIQQLQEEILALESKRDSEVASVLSDEQRARVAELMAEAQAKRRVPRGRAADLDTP